MAMLLLFILRLLTFPTALSQTTGNITLGSNITASENSTTWRSPSGDFAFGFQQLPNITDNSFFVLAIWFANIPDRTIVWFERTSYPVPRDSLLRLDPADGLVLRSPQGSILYTTNPLVGPVSSAFMSDTGNLVLLGSDSIFLWQSFANPADTILPTQTIEIGSSELVSRKSPADFSEGRFHASMTSNGNFVLNTKSSPSNTDFDGEFYNFVTPDTNSGNPVVFDERGSISVGSLTLTPISIPSISNYFYRATLDFDGVFTRYYFPRNSNSSSRWTVAGSWPRDICRRPGSGACGYNTICRLESGRPVCQCPRGFSLANPNNTYGDCKPNRLQTSCVQGENNEYDFLEVSDVDWPSNDYQSIRPSTSDDCRNACAVDCFCATSIFRSGQCWKKKLPLSDGRVDTSLGVVAFFKFRNSDDPIVNSSNPSPVNPKDDPFVNSRNPSPVNPKNNRQRLGLVWYVVLGSSAFVNILLISAACLSCFLIYNKRLPVSNQTNNVNLGTNLRCFTYKELEQATSGFKGEAGRGAIGIVYKGVVSNGEKGLVAVKKLDGPGHDSEKEFRAEVNAIGQTHHKNLVPLIGFCSEGVNRLLVYEYMSKGTLAEFLFGELKPSWNQRTQIAFGIARGLTYLHEECSRQIIHCDIKPQNILLDEHLNPRISDFGLAKLLMMDQSNTHTNIRGTKGYVAPEWFRNMKITVKVDVYSFGVLLLEIVSCRRSVENMEVTGENPILTDWVWDCFVDGRLSSLAENDAEALSDAETLERFVKVGIWCIQEDASLRPSMRRVFQMLEGSVQVGMPPSPYTINSETYA